jgi:hypothetical protein
VRSGQEITVTGAGMVHQMLFLCCILGSIDGTASCDPLRSPGQGNPFWERIW